GNGFVVDQRAFGWIRLQQPRDLDASHPAYPTHNGSRRLWRNRESVPPSPATSATSRTIPAASVPFDGCIFCSHRESAARLSVSTWDRYYPLPGSWPNPCVPGFVRACSSLP